MSINMGSSALKSMSKESFREEARELVEMFDLTLVREAGCLSERVFR